MTGRSSSRSSRRKRRPRGHIEQLPYGKFRAIVDAGVDPLTGRERRVREIAGTQEEAEVTLTRLLHQVDEQLHPKSSITLGEAIEQWLDVWRDQDPHAEFYRPWTVGAADLPPAAASLLATRQEALQKKEPRETRQLAEALQSVGVVVRDEGCKQSWRPLATTSG